MMIAKKALPRRTMLKAIGAALPLPLLDAMVPAMTALRQTPAAAPLRFGAVYVPNGVIPSMWLPAVEGSGFEFSPTLKPLEPYRDRLMVISGLDSLPPPPPGERQFNNHADASTRFLTDVTPSRTLRAGVSIDQIAAKSIGGDTMLPSLELALESVDSGTSCDFGRSCVYTGTISWAGPTSPLPMEHDPAAAFARLFGDGANSDAASRLASMRHKNSILDSLLGEVATLRNKVAAADRTRSGQLPRERARRRASHPARCGAQHRAAALRPPSGCAGDLCGSRQADVRHAAARVSRRRDTRGHLHGRP